MNPMRTRRKATIEDLRRAIDCLPSDTRIAMLEGIRSNEIVVGAYAHDKGICPMLAAHRAGGRTNFIAFARAWDRFAFRGTRSAGARRATERELLVLRSHLEASLLDDEQPGIGLAAAIAEHRELLARGERLPERIAVTLEQQEAAVHRAKWRKLIRRRASTRQPSLSSAQR
jgi:hypothetical protein